MSYVPDCRLTRNGSAYDEPSICVTAVLVHTTLSVACQYRPGNTVKSRVDGRVWRLRTDIGTLADWLLFTAVHAATAVIATV